MLKKTWELFDQMFEAFDAEMADAFKVVDGRTPSDSGVEEVREEEIRPDGTRVVRVTKRSRVTKTGVGR